jgi:hypothetical protein
MAGKAYRDLVARFAEVQSVRIELKIPWQGSAEYLGVFLAAPGDPHKQRRVVTGQKVQ